MSTPAYDDLSWQRRDRVFEENMEESQEARNEAEERQADRQRQGGGQ